MGSPAVSRFLYAAQNSEYKAKVKRIFSEEMGRIGVAGWLRRGLQNAGGTPSATCWRLVRWRAAEVYDGDRFQHADPAALALVAGDD